MRVYLVTALLLCSVYTVAISQDCVPFGEFTSLQTNTEYRATPDTVGPIRQKEISGIVPSIKYPGHFWAVNDSGNGAVLYLYALSDASLKALFILKGIPNTDWEDLSIMRNRQGEGIIHIADFGDNKAQRKVYTIYKIPEPELQEGTKINKLFIEPDRTRFSYQNGARDAEALAIDPMDSLSYVFTKREEEIFYYTLPAESTDSTLFLSPGGTIPLSMVVAADFSSDGKKFILKTYTNIYLWTRTSPTEPFCEMLSRKPKLLPYQVEPQGESICFIGTDFITVSEERFKIKPKLFRYRLQSN